MESAYPVLRELLTGNDVDELHLVAKFPEDGFKSVCLQKRTEIRDLLHRQYSDFHILLILFTMDFTGQ